MNKINSFRNVIPFLTSQQINNECVLVISHEKLGFIMQFLKLHTGLQYSLLSCISGVDLLKQTYRFCVVYDLLSLVFNSRIRVKLFINEITSIQTVTNIFINANWWEREVWDLYGIYFNKHPDLRRILTDYGFEGYPMRKDFPLSGFIELRYDETKKRVVIEPLEFTQEFRLFTYETPW
jgi:NADH dehydrogenase (ubiquinone) Fe-S protein 3